METIHSHVRYVWVTTTVSSAMMVAILVGILDRYVLHVGLWLPVSTAVLLSVCGILFVFVRYRVWQFEVQDDALVLEHGVVTRVESAVPFVRIQHVDTKRGPIERAAGLASVGVYTAGSRGSDVTIPGLSPERARELQQRLRDLATESEEDAV